MIAFVNGTWVPEQAATISIFDRSFRYGDGVFETILVVNGTPFRWAQHAARLETSADYFKISLPHSEPELRALANELIARNGMRHAILRIQLSRGVGPRGYAPSGNEHPIVVMTLHPSPESRSMISWTMAVSGLRVTARDPLASHKTCSRMLQVMAANEARQRGVDECLILNVDGEIAEGSSSNVFWIEKGNVYTPPLSAGALRGVTRAAVLECCRTLGIPHGEQNLLPNQLRTSEGVFLSLTSRGIIEATTLDGQTLSRSPITSRLQSELESLIAAECP